jgi:hypothetical protein
MHKRINRPIFKARLNFGCLIVFFIFILTNSSQASTPPVAAINGAPSGYTNQPNPAITVAGDNIVSYRYKLNNGNYSDELPVSTIIDFSSNVIIDNQSYNVGSPDLYNYINNRSTFVNNLQFTHVNSDTNVVYLLNSKRFVLTQENIVNIEGDIGINALTINLNNPPAGNAGELQSFSIAGGRLQQTDSTIESFSFEIPPGMPSVVITPTVSDVNTIILINDNPVTSGTTSAPIAVTDGSSVTLEAIAQDGTSKTYSIAITVNQSLNATTSHRSFYLKTDSLETDYISIHNNGNVNTTFKMNLNNKIFSSNDDLLNKISTMPPEYQGEPLYRKAWRFVRDNRYHWDPLTGNTWQHNPALLLNSIGYGFCDDSAAIYSSLVTALGFQTRVWMLNGHVVPEVYVNNNWEVFDPDGEVYYYDYNNNIAGVDELSAHPDLITNPITPVENYFKWPYSDSVAYIYSSTWDNYILSTDNQLPSYELQFQIPPSGLFEFPRTFSPNLTGESNYSAPPIYTNARLVVPNGWTGTIDIPLVVQTIDYADEHTLSVLGKDNNGNWQTVPTVASWEYDITPPVVTAYQASGAYNRVEPVTLWSNKSATIYYTTDGSLPTTGSSVYTTPISPASTIQYFAVDNAGNSGAVNAYPSIRLWFTSKPSPYLIGSHITFTAQATLAGQSSGGAGIYEYRFTLYNSVTSTWTTVQDYSSNTSWTWDTTNYLQGNYYLQVWTRSVGSLAQYDTYQEADCSLTTVLPATNVTISSDKASPQAKGNKVTFTGQASGGTGNYEYKFELYNYATSNWTTVQDYSSEASWVWDTTSYTTGSYSLQIWARCVGSTLQYDTYKGTDFSLTFPPATSVTLTSDKTSPQIKGNQITFTGQASGGTGNYEYNFWLNNATTGTWTSVQSYSSNSKWVWDTTSCPPGNYTVEIKARSIGNTGYYDTYADKGYTIIVSPATGVSLSASMASPQIQGNKITFTGQASGGSGSYEYNFWLNNATTGTWTSVQSYSSNSKWVWDTTSYPPGNYTVEIKARSIGNTGYYDTYADNSYTIMLPPATGVSLSASKASPQIKGNQITFTGQASGGTGNYEYNFWLNNATTGTWTSVQSYSSNSKWVWDTTSYPPGNYTVEIKARNIGNTGSYDTYADKGYSIIVFPATGVSLSASMASPQIQGNQITFTGQARGGTENYEYNFWLYNATTGKWMSVQSYSSNSKWIWDTTSYPPGNYTVEIKARSIGNTGSYDTYADKGYTIIVSPATGVSLSASMASPQIQGNQITFTGQARGGTENYEYNFWLYNATTGKWISVQSYSSNSKWIWDTSNYSSGSYSVQIKARSIGNTGSYDTYATLSYAITNSIH